MITIWKPYWPSRTNVWNYAGQAKKMQESLTDYPAGTPEEIHAYWALNDVATSLFIQGEAYRKAGMMNEE